MRNIFSVDVEDWFHALGSESTPDDIDTWNNLESRIKTNFYALLDEFDRTDTKATCFFLGWVAERFPETVKEACERGHEIASHGYSHRLIGSMSRQEFYEDILRTKILLEDISGQGVTGYRSAGFSITEDTIWALEELVKAGYKYDSSIFPASRDYGGIRNADLFPHLIETGSGSIIEFPVSVSSVLGRRICFFGGGYLRLFPLSVIRYMSKRVNDENRPVIYYIHPREIDPDHPRMQMGWKRRFKSYINLKTTMPKLKDILAEQELTSFENWLAEHDVRGLWHTRVDGRGGTGEG